MMHNLYAAIEANKKHHNFYIQANARLTPLSNFASPEKEPPSQYLILTRFQL